MYGIEPKRVRARKEYESLFVALAIANLTWQVSGARQLNVIVGQKVWFPGSGTPTPSKMPTSSAKGLLSLPIIDGISKSVEDD